MKTTKLISALILVLSATAAVAGPYRPAPQPIQFSDTARVISSTPVYDEVNNPRQECWTERSGYDYDRGYERGDRSYGGAILGALVGGVVGNQFGKGSGKKAATAAGAAIGAISGDNIDNSDRYARRRPVEEERCRTVDNWSRRIAGYDVVYRYKGEEYSTFMAYDPGSSINLRVSVSVDPR